MEWWERLGKIIETRGLSVEDVAAKARLPVKSLYGYLKGEVDNPRGDVVERLARAVGTTEQALRYGDAPSNVVALRRIPLLDMKKLGALKLSQDPMTTWDGVTFVSVPNDIPDGAYGITLVDNSGEGEFSEGDVVVCDPTADVTPGRYVVAVVIDDKAAYFGKFRPLAHGDRRNFEILRPNPDYPKIEVGGRLKGFILARAVRHIRKI